MPGAAWSRPAGPPAGSHGQHQRGELPAIPGFTSQVCSCWPRSQRPPLRWFTPRNTNSQPTGPSPWRLWPGQHRIRARGAGAGRRTVLMASGTLCEKRKLPSSTWDGTVGAPRPESTHGLMGLYASRKQTYCCGVRSGPGNLSASHRGPCSPHSQQDLLKYN